METELWSDVFPRYPPAPNVLDSLLLTVVNTIIADLRKPRRSLIEMGLQRLIDLSRT